MGGMADPPGAGESPRRLPLGPMRGSWLDVGIAVGTLVAAFCLVGYLFVTMPDERWWATLALAAVVLPPLALYSRSWLEPGGADRPAVLAQKYLWRTARRVSLTEGARVEVVTRGPGVALEARRGDGRPVRAVLAVAGEHPRSRTPDELRALADAVDARGVAGQRAATVLRAQADHLAAGGDVVGSPVFGGFQAVWSALRPRARRVTGSNDDAAS